MKSSRKAVALVFVFMFAMQFLLPIANSAPTAMGVPSSAYWLNENTFVEKFPDGTNYQTIYAGAVAYDAGDGTYQPIDTTIQTTASPTWGYSVNKGVYEAYFTDDLSKQWHIGFVYGNHVLRTRFLQVGYYDASQDKIVELANVNQNAPVSVSGSSITYQNIYGQADVRVTYQNEQIKEEVLIPESTVSSLPDPSSLGLNPATTYLVGGQRLELTGFSTDTNGNYTANIIRFKDVSKELRFFFPISEAWDGQVDETGALNNTVEVNYRIYRNNGNTFLLYGVPYSWISTTSGDVTIDPTTTIQPSDEDAFVWQTFPTTNYGSWTSIRTYELTGELFRSFINFTISLSSSVIITNANLSLYYYEWYDDNPVGRTVNVQRVTADWDEGTVNWNNQPAVSASVSDGATFPASYGWMYWNVTDDVQSFVNGTNSNFGWRISDSAEGQPDGRQGRFYSREFTTANLRPSLTITYSEPTLNLHVFAADGSTEADDIISTYLSVENSTGTFGLQVSSGWVNMTGLSGVQNITAQAYNTTNTNSYVKVNQSSILSITLSAGELTDVSILLSIYQSVTLTYRRDDGTTFTPSFFEVTLGNNGTQVNMTSPTTLVNGSTTVNRLYMYGQNVQNSTNSFNVTSDAQTLEIYSRIYAVTLSAVDVTSGDVGNVQFNITWSYNGTSTALVSTDATGDLTLQLQNDTITITAWWHGILVSNGTTYTVTAADTHTVSLQVGRDGESKTLFAEGGDINGANSMLIEAIDETYKVEPSYISINATVYTSGNFTGTWNYTSALNLLNVTHTDFKTNTTIHTIGINTALRRINFNATGSETIFYVYYLSYTGSGTQRTVTLKVESTGATFPTPDYYSVNVTAFYPSTSLVVSQNQTSFTVYGEPLLVAQITDPFGTQYFRTLIPSQVSQSMYIPDLRISSITRFTIEVTDLPHTYTAGTVRIYVGGIEVASGTLDAAYQMGVYLINGLKYDITIIGSESTFSDLGLNANPSQTLLRITIDPLPAASTRQTKSDRLYWTIVWSGGNVVITFTDLDALTSAVTVTLYEENGTRLFNNVFQQVYATSNFTASYAGNASRSYYSKLDIVNSRYGSFSEVKSPSMSALGMTFPSLPIGVLGLNNIFPISGGWTYLISAFVVIATAFVFSSLSSNRGAIVVALIGAFLTAANWLPGVFAYATVAVLLAVVAHLSRERLTP